MQEKNEVPEEASQKTKLEKILDEFEPEYKYPAPITFLLITAVISLWSIIYLRAYIDVDTSWLLECLDRFLAGGTYIKDYYETNPPLSFLIYLPAYPLYTYFDLDPKLSVFLTITLYLGISDYTLLCLLRKEKIKAQDLLVIMTALLISQSWIAGISFALKDHLITAFILPISLYQYRLTRGLNTGKFLTSSSVILGGILVCLKPHYALIPALFFAHRLYTTRSLARCITTPDFWGMLIIGASYILSIWIFTPEFFDLLPQIISLYSVDRPFPLSMRYYYVIYGIFAALSAPFIFSDKSQSALKNSVYALSALSVICMIPFIIQDKGFHYQALPTLSLGASALFIAIYGFSKDLFKCKNDIALWIAAASLIMVFGTILYNYKKPTLTKNQFMALPLVDAIDNLAWNRVYANYYYKHGLACLPKISSLKNGSRFGEIWPLTGLTDLINSTSDPEEKAKIKAQMYKIVDLMVEDMKRFKPSAILIPQFTDPQTNKPAKNYYEFLNKHEGFKNNFSNYTYYDTILFSLDPTIEATSDNFEKYPDQIVPHEIYILKRDNTL